MVGTTERTANEKREVNTFCEKDGVAAVMTKTVRKTEKEYIEVTA